MSADRARARFERRLERLLLKEARRLYFEDLKVTLANVKAQERELSAELDRLAEDNARFVVQLDRIRADVLKVCRATS